MIKVKYHRHNDGVTIWVHREEQHIATFHINRHNKIKVFKGEKVVSP